MLITSVLSDGGCNCAAPACMCAENDEPHMPTAPVEYDCLASHSITSYPSVASAGCTFENLPSDLYRPRVSCNATTYPRCAKNSACDASDDLLYGVRLSSTGKRSFTGRPFFPGRYTSVDMRLPSRVGIIKSFSTSTASYLAGDDFHPDGGIREASPGCGGGV